MWAHLEPWWPDFQWDNTSVLRQTTAVDRLIGRLNAAQDQLPSEVRDQYRLENRINELLGSYKIEGVTLDREDVRSSLIKALDLSLTVDPGHDVRAEGAARLDRVVQDQFESAHPLTPDHLIEWQRLMSPSLEKTAPLGLRTEDIGIYSQTGYATEAHYLGPDPERVPALLADFLHWFNSTDPRRADPVKTYPPFVRAGLAHLWFEQIHPLADGNGRIGRALAEFALAQDLGRWPPFSLSAAILERKADYYDQLERAGRQARPDITTWLNFWLSTVETAGIDARERSDYYHAKSALLNQVEAHGNARQVTLINRLLTDDGQEFKGGLSREKYEAITGASRATAARDIQDLVDRRILVPLAVGGPRQRYALNISVARSRTPLGDRDVNKLSASELRGAWLGEQDAILAGGTLSTSQIERLDAVRQRALELGTLLPAHSESTDIQRLLQAKRPHLPVTKYKRSTDLIVATIKHSMKH